MKAHRLRAAAFLLAVLACCTPTNQLKGTAILLSMLLPDAVAVDQLRISAANGAGTVFSPVLRPETASATALSTPQTVHVLLPNKDAAATFFVDGLFEGAVVATGKATSEIRAGVELKIDVNLSPGQGCGDCQGCCAGTACVATPTAGQCGPEGGACADCGLGADSCNVGACGCGKERSCSAGQQCIDGKCACTAESCANGCCTKEGVCIAYERQTNVNCGAAGHACESCGSCNGQGVCVNDCKAENCLTGCCSGKTCVHPAQSACGLRAATCVVCDAVRADTCGITGACGCGLNAACSDTQRCSNGACVPR